MSKSNLPSLNKVPLALERIEQQLQNLKKVSELPPRTDGKFRWNPAYTGNAPIYIHETTDLELLINIYASLKAKDIDYNNAAESLGLSEYPVFKWMNYPLLAWENDLKQRILIITQHQKREELLEKKERLEEFLTKEHRLSSLLDDDLFKDL